MNTLHLVCIEEGRSGIDESMLLTGNCTWTLRERVCRDNRNIVIVVC